MQCYLPVHKSDSQLQFTDGLICLGLALTQVSFVCFAGVIPIDRLTDVRTPVAVVCQRIARREFERVYGLKLPKPDEHDAPDK